MIGDAGPYRFIIDTGANRTAISRRLAQALALEVGPSASQVVVHGITGSAIMPLIELGSLRVGTFGIGRQRVAVLPDAVFGNADGILGIDVLQKARIDIDFDRDKVVVRAARTASSEGRLVVRGKLRSGGLMIVPARVGRVRVQAIVDTGAERTIGNEALR
ncbi:MAG TPA: retropepsin-like aspartic protease, partial [Steroidobacteraceae bacterium]